jgi:hypothetical protein
MTNKITVHEVPIEFVQQTWHLAKEFIVAGLQEGGGENSANMTYNDDHVLSYLVSGVWSLFIAVGEDGLMKGAATVSYINYPIHRVAFITAVGGRLIASQDSFNQLKNLFKARGATMVQGYGRPAIVRLWKRFDFQPRSTLLEVSI